MFVVAFFLCFFLVCVRACVRAFARARARASLRVYLRVSAFPGSGGRIAASLLAKTSRAYRFHRLNSSAALRLGRCRGPGSR